jgi:ABC-type spermidine/putrescine transport system permease subunit II
VIYLDSSVALAHLLVDDRLASYDERLLSAARRLGVEVHTL